jgi:hypothetical protein
LAIILVTTTADASSFAATIPGADTVYASGPTGAELHAHDVEPLVAIARTQPHRPYDFRLPPKPRSSRRLTETWCITMKGKLETEDGKNRYKKCKHRRTCIRHHQ